MREAVPGPAHPQALGTVGRRNQLQLLVEGGDAVAMRRLRTIPAVRGENHDEIPSARSAAVGPASSWASAAVATFDDR